ncbi:MAG: hypothetical protein OEY07_20525, partial [Gammaproteobacteria bacterium]|nr:hypothetical protein [Gammaproteobacteria bacterium]
MTLPALSLPKTARFRLIWLPGQLLVSRTQAWSRRIGQQELSERLLPCVQQIQRLNRAYRPPRTRLAQLAAFQNALFDCFVAEKELIRLSRNLPKGTVTTVQQLDNLYAHIADGYKLVIHQLASLPELDDENALLIQEAIYFALKFLARRLLLAYAQYLPLPKGVWRELHQIYRYADENALLFHIIDDQASDVSFPVFHSGDFIYKRITLVALAEPYRLMQDECIELYSLSSHWTSACSLFPLGKLSTQGEHVVDLADDQPPRFVTPDLSWRPMDGRVIDITEVVERLEKDLAGLLRNEKRGSEFDLLDLEERQKRDMLLRVITTYQGKPVRRSKRFSLTETVEFVTTISACHQQLLQNKAYSPEMDELKLISAMHRENGEATQERFANRYKIALEKDQRSQRSAFTLHT